MIELVFKESVAGGQSPIGNSCDIIEHQFCE